MKKEKSCGILVFDNDEVLVVFHNLGHYGFPKGHVEKGETEEETAVREVKEETNCDAKIIPGFREVITYSPKPNVIKDVVFFIGEPITKELKPQEEETQDVFFVKQENALKMITHEEERELLEKAIAFKNGEKYEK